MTPMIFTQCERSLAALWRRRTQWSGFDGHPFGLVGLIAALCLTTMAKSAVAALIAVPALLWLKKQAFEQHVIRGLSAIVMLVGVGLFAERLMNG